MTLISQILHPNNPYYRMFSTQGYWEVLRYKIFQKPVLALLARLRKSSQPAIVVKTHLEAVSTPVFFRHGTSDEKVLFEIYILGEYACTENLAPPQLIVDCGANVGYASLYFLQRYPKAQVICVEPDEQNLELCQQNLAAYQSQVTLIQSGIWSDSVGLVIEHGKVGEEWGIQVREVQDGEVADLQATDLKSLLDASGFCQIDLLKLDIEGAEAVLFEANYETWLPNVKNIVIELHNDTCRDRFFQAMSAYEYEIAASGAVVCCMNLRPKTA